ncbi:MAG: AAA family ATPase [Candidatus Mcinerneyibacterium aminivorans]|uniref:AAA family ATPase n=1 Tax=Candidatus Mcinerneyibacterium aminivorans TaxID=2703815 RepID=A0A5D0MFN8_9BACT|nr:MAG: AAA family ATPase [Candidatus Mcinerneyibacterium aminivorans]
MLLKKMHLKNFRNLRKEKVTFFPSVNVIVGNNGSGKSNLLEAIYLFYKGKSFRKSKLIDMINWEKDFFRIKISTDDEMYNNLFFYYDKKKIFNME